MVAKWTWKVEEDLSHLAGALMPLTGASQFLPQFFPLSPCRVSRGSPRGPFFQQESLEFQQMAQ